MTPTDSYPNALTVGIDIGGTKTHLRATSVAGGSDIDLVVPSIEWRKRDWDQDAEGLLQLVARLAESAPVLAIGVGAHGCDDADECRTFQAAIAARTSVPVVVVNDAELMPLALDLPRQIGVVAGTGSIAVCRPTADRMMVAGGWGWIISDEGSAASLVREATRAVARYFDAGHDRGEPLVEAMLGTLNVSSVPRLGSALGSLRSATEVGTHVLALFEAAERGSQLAAQVIREGGRALASMAALLNERGAGASHVVAGGTVIVAQPRLWQAFVEGVAATAPGLTPHLFSGKPVEGAGRLAASLIAPA